ncbi:MAG: hypothetical protein AAF318_13785 [Pseudomonadota bacterium]
MGAGCAERSLLAGGVTIAPVPFNVPRFGVHIFWSERYDTAPINTWLRTTVLDATRSSAQSPLCLDNAP